MRDYRALLRRNSLELLLVGVSAAALTLVAVSVWRVAGTPAPAVSRLLLAAGLVVLGNAPLLRLRFGSHGSSFTYGEAAVVLAIPLLPPAWLILVGAAGAVVTQLSGRIPARKAMFNAANFTVALAAAVGVVHLVDPVPPRGLTWGWQVVGLLLGMGTFAVLENTGVSAAIAFAQDRPLRTVVRRSLPVNALVAVVNLGIGLAVLLLARWDVHSLLLLPAFVAAVAGTYRGYLLAIQSRDTWQHLELAGKDLNRLEEDSLADAVLHHAQRLFDADWVELSLDAGGELPARRYRRGTTAAAEHAGATVVPLRSGDTDLGSLTVGFTGAVKFSARESQVLTNFANSVSAAVANARLYGDLRLEAARRAFEATHDPLTGLANRRLLLSSIEYAAAVLPPDRVCALLLVDVDHFKEINDTLGHAAGDVLLCRVGDRLLGGVGGEALVARLASDEFAVLLPAVEEHDIDAVALDLQGTLAEPVSLDGVRLSVEVSIGAAGVPLDGTDPGDLLRRSHVALTAAKQAGASFRRYRAEDDSSSLSRLELAAELRTALAAGELVVHFQPQLDIQHGRITGAEALLRWQHPVRGLLLPGDFIDIVEQSGLIRPVTLHVLDTAVAQVSAWTRRGDDMQVSVNLSPRSLLDRQLPEDVGQILRRHRVHPGSVILEITETSVMSELEIVEDVLAGLRALGVELAVDDFGTGYSSLALLQRIAVHEMKVDRSFVAGLLTSDSDAAIVRATVELAHSLNARAVAEGVESNELLSALRRLGCDRAQGFYVARPTPAASLDLTPRRAGASRIVQLPERPART
jgi:diguanylate cyclase (GGDEF)-like protein